MDTCAFSRSSSTCMHFQPLLGGQAHLHKGSRHRDIHSFPTVKKFSWQTRVRPCSLVKHLASTCSAPSAGGEDRGRRQSSTSTNATRRAPVLPILPSHKTAAPSSSCAPTKPSWTRIGRDANGKASGNVVENTAVETSSQESLPINLLQGTAKGAKAVPSGDTTPPWIGRMDNRDDEQGSPRSSTSVAPSPAPAKPWIPSKASASHTLSTSEHHARQSDRPLGPASPTPPVDTPARRSVRAPDFTRKERRSDDSRRWRIVAGQQPLEMVAFLRQRIKASRWLGGKAVEELDPEELSELVVEMDVLRESLQACSYLRRSPLVLASCRQPVRLSREGGGLKTQSMEEELRLQLQQRTVAQAMTRAVVGDAVGMEGHSGLAAHMMGVEEALREASGGANVDAKESALAQAIYQLEHGGEQVEAIAAVAERAAVMESVLRGVPRIAQVAALERELEGMEMRAAASGDAMLCRMMEEKQAMLEEALVDMEASMGVIPSKAQLDDLVAALDMLEAKLGADPDQASAAMEHWSAALGVAEWLWIERVEQKCEELRNTTGFLQQLYASFDRDLDERC